MHCNAVHAVLYRQAFPFPWCKIMPIFYLGQVLQVLAWRHWSLWGLQSDLCRDGAPRGICRQDLHSGKGEHILKGLSKILFPGRKEEERGYADVSVECQIPRLVSRVGTLPFHGSCALRQCYPSIPLTVGLWISPEMSAAAVSSLTVTSSPQPHFWAKLKYQIMSHACCSSLRTLSWLPLSQSQSKEKFCEYSVIKLWSYAELLYLTLNVAGPCPS